LAEPAKSSATPDLYNDDPGDTTLGALNAYSRRRNAFSAAAEEIGYVLATHAAIAWDPAARWAIAGSRVRR
jgi:hypothetical protein